ncbi:hypothetical protein GWK48_00385 [Metallosphaera tengchongensis]|uniref:Uncharacterized protein n=1 Tax=Metallosphaera tengchongensis TaxID=1532350 RepID=A0A6N0NS87_9CREN|nr:hypothetical protein [Metallosphaera tengchongensis]QKQ99054.1 hypothetical protein GWK48_00385 [Metallosphaera tengchongensis]
MISKLVKTIIFSRFPKSTILVILAIDLLLVLSDFPSHPVSRALSPEFSLLSITYITFLVAISPFNSRFNLVTKSDWDFLIMVPADDRELILSLVLGYFLVSLLFSAVFLAWFLFALGLVGLLIPPFLALIVSSASASVYNLGLKFKALVSVLMGIWFASALLRFPFSPLSMFEGYPYGYFILPIFSLTLFGIALRRFNFTNFSTLSYTPPGKQEIKTEISFSSRNPLLLMLTKNLKIFEIGGRMNLMGSYTYVSRRIEWWKVLAISTASSVAAYFLASRFPGTVFYVAFATWLFSVSYSNSAFMSEPIWLDMNVMNPIEFARYYLLSKLLSMVLVLLPVSISVAALGYLPLGIGILVDVPLGSIMIMSLYARFYQINLQNPMTFSLSRYLVGFLTFLPFVGVLIQFFLPLISVTLGATIYEAIISIPFLLSKGYWEKVIEKYVTTVT